MFTVNTVSERYETLVLADSTTASAVKLVPERGGIVTEIAIGERQILYLDRDRFDRPELSVRGGIPILFPICGNLPGDRYTWEGETFQLPQHGFARNLPWSVTNTETAADAAVTLTLKDSPATLAVYPFAFELTFTYRWSGTTLQIDQQVHNRSQRTMPFSVGFHPYFAVQDKSRLTFQLPVSVYSDRANQQSGQFQGMWDYDRDEIDAAFESISAGESLTAQVRDAAAQISVTLTGGPEFRHLVFWTVRDKPFYCLEPWSAPRNAINTGTDTIALEAGDSYRTFVALQFEGG
jgi:galactose mutarotase-like enzyme